MSTGFNISDELRKLPQKPGVYIMKNAADGIIYIGKAVNLRSRVRQYFRQSAQEASPKLKSLSPNIATFEYIVTDSEIEALILENTLIKKHRPRYNVLLKDDKSYAYLKLTMDETFPRLIIARQVKKDKARYFGPFVSSQTRTDILEAVQKIWPIRTCAKKLGENPANFERPCLNYHIGRCKAPCNGLISREEYGVMIQEVLAVLNGKTGGIVKRLEAEMAANAANMEFEKAAYLRDKINALRVLDEQQKLDTAGADDQDVLGIAKNGDTALVQIFFVRGGKMTGREQLMMTGAQDQDASDIVTGFVKQFYSETTLIPGEIVLGHDLPERGLLAAWLSHLRGAAVSVTVAKKGEKLGLCELAANNAKLSLDQFGEHIAREHARTTSAADELFAALSIPASAGGAERIEAYDISNTSGVLAVGSMVVFENGKPKNSDYRKFRIKYGDGQSDHDSLREVIARRFLRYKQELEDGGEHGKFLKLPRLILMDGAAAQVAAAEGILEDLGIDIPVAGMVKDNRHRTSSLLYKGREVTLPRKSEGFKLLTRIQDEVHRFAVEYHRRLREREMTRSRLDDIRGIGPARRKALMRHFKDIDTIRFAGEAELAAIPGMTAAAAKAVYEYFYTE